jgi:hypothetical protein
LPYLLRVPLGAGLVFSTAGTWPRSKALYCHPLGLEDWPDDAEVVERTGLRSCRRRGAAIDLILDRSWENRSQLVFTTARGRDAVFWQTPRVRKQARPQVRTPTARAAGVAELEIIVDARERYPYRFGRQAVHTLSRVLPCGGYGIVVDGRLVAAVERKSLADLVASLTGGKLRYALGDLAALPRAALVVEDRYSQIYQLDRVRPAVVADGLAEYQLRWANVPIVFCETRQPAEEWTYRFLAAAYSGRSANPLRSPASPGPPPTNSTTPRPHPRTHGRRSPGLGPRQQHPSTGPRTSAARGLGRVARGTRPHRRHLTWLGHPTTGRRPAVSHSTGGDEVIEPRGDSRVRACWPTWPAYRWPSAS